MIGKVRAVKGSFILVYLVYRRNHLGVYVSHHHGISATIMPISSFLSACRPGSSHLEGEHSGRRLGAIDDDMRVGNRQTPSRGGGRQAICMREIRPLRGSGGKDPDGVGRRDRGWLG